MKKILIAVLLIAVVGAAIFWFTRQSVKAPVVQKTDYKSISYVIAGQTVMLVNGYAETPAAPGSASKVITQYFGNEATGDLSGDGVSDIAFLLSQTGGGSGTFYYVVVAIKTPTGYVGTNAVLLGDRIAPQTTQIEYGEVVVNYADRAAGEPMTASPTVGVSKYLLLAGPTLREITPSEYAAGNLLLGTDASAKLGTYLIGSNAMTLYVYAKDTAGVSNCIDSCAANWPPYTLSSKDALGNIQAGVKGTVGTITRADGSLQVTYKGAPLYFYHLDKKSGDTAGNGVGGVWSVVKP